MYKSGYTAEDQHGVKMFWSAKNLEDAIQRHPKRLLVRHSNSITALSGFLPLSNMSSLVAGIQLDVFS